MRESIMSSLMLSCIFSRLLKNYSQSLAMFGKEKSLFGNWYIPTLISGPYLEGVLHRIT